MKKIALVLISCLATHLAYAAPGTKQSALRITLPLGKASAIKVMIPDDFQVLYQSPIDTNSIREWIPQDENLANWTRMITIQEFHNISQPISTWKKVLKKEYKKSGGYSMAFKIQPRLNIKALNAEVEMPSPANTVYLHHKGQDLQEFYCSESCIEPNSRCLYSVAYAIRYPNTLPEKDKEHLRNEARNFLTTHLQYSAVEPKSRMNQ